MTMAYVIALIVGGGMLLISTVFGGHGDAGVDGDVGGGLGGDVHADVPSDVHHGGVGHGAHDASSLSLTKWFSMQFLVYFAAAFGLIGTVLTFGTSMGSTPVLLWSLGAGVVVGQIVHQAIRALRRTSGTGEAVVDDYLDKTGRVTIPVGPKQRGEVAVFVKGIESYLPASARRPGDRFEVGAQAFVVGFSDGVAEIVSKEEYEFLNEGK